MAASGEGGRGPNYERNRVWREAVAAANRIYDWANVAAGEVPESVRRKAELRQQQRAKAKAKAATAAAAAPHAHMVPVPPNVTSRRGSQLRPASRSAAHQKSAACWQPPGREVGLNL